MNAEADQHAKHLERVELAPAFEAFQPYNSASKLHALQPLRAVRRSFGATVSKRAGKPSFSESVCRVTAAGNPVTATGRGSEAAFADIGGPSDLPACCYGDGMEGLRCYYGILRGFPLPMRSGNIQHPTSNSQHSLIAQMAAIGCSRLDVACWMFPSFGSGVQSANTGIRGILSLCPVLRQTPLPGGPQPPRGSSSCILTSSFCLPLANQLAVHPDGPGPRWSLRRVGSQ